MCEELYCIVPNRNLQGLPKHLNGHPKVSEQNLLPQNMVWRSREASRSPRAQQDFPARTRPHQTPQHRGEGGGFPPTRPHTTERGALPRPFGGVGGRGGRGARDHVYIYIYICICIYIYLFIYLCMYYSHFILVLAVSYFVRRPMSFVFLYLFLFFSFPAIRAHMVKKKENDETSLRLFQPP